VPEFEQLLFSAAPGTYDVVQTQFGWHVVNVIERVTTPLAEAEPELRRPPSRSRAPTRTQELLRTTAADLGVTVNSRFGRWDAEKGTVEPTRSPRREQPGAAGRSRRPARRARPAWPSPVRRCSPRTGRAAAARPTS
jgi:hypothetical protein